MSNMKRKYANISKRSNVKYTEYNQDLIKVFFKDKTQYTYTYLSASADVIEKMKESADRGSGLNSYISKNKPPYESKTRY